MHWEHPCDLDHEIQNCIRLAWTSFSSLKEHAIWSQALTIKTKVEVYEAICWSVLLYGSKTWTLYRAQLRRLETFHILLPTNHLWDHLAWADPISDYPAESRNHHSQVHDSFMSAQMGWPGYQDARGLPTLYVSWSTKLYMQLQVKRNAIKINWKFPWINELPQLTN